MNTVTKSTDGTRYSDSVVCVGDTVELTGYGPDARGIVVDLEPRGAWLQIKLTEARKVGNMLQKPGNAVAFSAPRNHNKLRLIACNASVPLG